MLDRPMAIVGIMIEEGQKYWKMVLGDEESKLNTYNKGFQEKNYRSWINVDEISSNYR